MYTECRNCIHYKTYEPDVGGVVDDEDDVPRVVRYCELLSNRTLTWNDVDKAYQGDNSLVEMSPEEFCSNFDGRTDANQNPKD